MGRTGGGGKLTSQDRATCLPLFQVICAFPQTKANSLAVDTFIVFLFTQCPFYLCAEAHLLPGGLPLSLHPCTEDMLGFFFILFCGAGF
jgi:hypothetical protein